LIGQRWEAGLRKSTLALAGVIAVAMGGCQQSPTTTKSNVMNDPKDAIKLADAARDSGDFAVAIKLYNRAIENHGDTYEARLGLGVALAGAGEADQAETELRTAARMEPSKIDPDLALGRLSVQRHHPQEALLAFDAALILAPDSVPAWNGKGIALDMLERHLEAQECYRNGLARAPKDRNLHDNYGLSLALSGNYDEAIKELTALAQEPGATARNRQNLALALGLKGDVADARTVARTDLDEVSVASNLRFYEAARQAPVPKQSAVLPVGPVSLVPAGTAQPAAATDTPIASDANAPQGPKPPGPLAPDAIAAQPLPAPAGDTVGGAPVTPAAPVASAPPVPLTPQ
jgi:Flp pilus assembly protein TadD